MVVVKRIILLYSHNRSFFNVTQQKNKLETVQWKKPRKMKCYKRLIYRQFVQVSGLCGPQFLSYLPKRFMHLCRALYGDAILVYHFGPPINGHQKSTKTSGVHFLYRSSFFPSRTSIHVHKHIF